MPSNKTTHLIDSILSSAYLSTIRLLYMKEFTENLFLKSRDSNRYEICLLSARHDQTLFLDIIRGNYVKR
mgnify:CR=1 FL=1